MAQGEGLLTQGADSRDRGQGRTWAGHPLARAARGRAGFWLHGRGTSDIGGLEGEGLHGAAREWRPQGGDNELEEPLATGDVCIS